MTTVGKGDQYQIYYAELLRGLMQQTMTQISEITEDAVSDIVHTIGLIQACKEDHSHLYAHLTKSDRQGQDPLLKVTNNLAKILFTSCQTTTKSQISPLQLLYAQSELRRLASSNGSDKHCGPSPFETLVSFKKTAATLLVRTRPSQPLFNQAGCLMID